MEVKIVNAGQSSIIKKIVAIMLILVLTMADFALVGIETVSYAADLLNMGAATNNRNVTFDTYFKDLNGNKISSKEESITSGEMKLYAQISVKNDGYFNGSISLENSNFKIRNEILSDSINKIEGNTITFNQINADETAEIELGIEPILEDAIRADFLNMQSSVILNGIYRNSEERDINITASRQVQLILTNPYIDGEGMELTSEMLTNKVYEIDGKSKRIVQVLVESGLEGNKYPVKENNIEISVPEGIEKAYVNSRGTLVSNGKNETEFTNNNWTYNEKEHKLNVTIKNNDEGGKINWVKTGKDKIIVTYIMDTKTNLTEKEISVNSKIKLYDLKETLKEKNTTVKVQEEKDGIVTAGVEVQEDNIYKGKIYSGEDREYKVKTNIYMNNSEARKNASFDLTQPVYETNGGEILANSQFRITEINKQNIERVLGQDGIITISANGIQIMQINKDTQTDENGNITITYPEGTTAIKVETTEAKQVGTIILNNTKVIKNDGNSKETKHEYMALRENITDQYSKMTLNETSLEARMDINRTNLSTMVENNGVEITTILKTNSEKNDLYKNPSIRIELPSQVENASINSVKVLYDNELNVVSSNIIEENGKKFIIVNLEGEQTKHQDGTVEGTTIIVNANLILNKKATNSDEAIKMTCTNLENNTVLNIEKAIKVVSPRGMVTLNSINDYGMSSIGAEETKVSKLELGASEKQSQVNIEVINNNEEMINDVKVLGEFPTKNETNTIETQVSEVQVSGANATVYYTENENATDNLQDSSNKWSTEITNNSAVKKYLISIDNMEQSQGIAASYRMNIPASLQYNEQAYEGYKVTYNNSNTSSEVEATKLGLSTGKGPEVKATIKASLGNMDLSNGAEIAQGEVIRYELTAENTGTETATNVNLTASVPEGTIYIEPKENFVYEEGYYNEFADKKEVTYDIESIAAGEKVTKTFEVKVTKNAQTGKNIENKAIAKYGEATTESDSIKTKIVEGSLSVTVKRATDLKTQNYNGAFIEYLISVENISEKAQKNTEVNVRLPQELEMIKAYILNDTGKEEIEATQKIKINDINVGETKYIYIVTEIKSLGNDDSKIVNVSSIAKSDNSNEARSNEFEDTVKDFKLNISMTADNENGYLQSNDAIEYTIKVENITNVDSTAIDITDSIPEELSIQSVTVNGEEQEIIEENDLVIIRNIPANSVIEAKVRALVDYDETRDEPVQITNVANLIKNGEVIATSGEISHIIKAETPEIEDPNIDPNNPDEPVTIDEPNNSEQNENGIVSGVAWLDENRDGQRDAEENLLEGVAVKLVDREGNIVKDASGNELVATTNNKGFYMISNVPQGEYLVVFDYDTSAYALTAYKKDGISDSKNSDVITKQFSINGEEGVHGVTDTIAVNNDGVSNIDIGLVKATKFDLELNKYISKIVVQAGKDTKTYTYDKATLAKAEIAAKQLQGTNVIIEYQIEVKNAGEVAGYVKNIVDYMPSSLKFSSELNTAWHQSGSNLYNNSLANTKIEPGETKEITLTLTKTMTEENTGLINNTAEIAESYNEAGIQDTDSVAGNKAKGEDDMGSADVILGVKTGAMAAYIGLIIAVIAVMGIAGYIVNKTVDKKHQIKDII